MKIPKVLILILALSLTSACISPKINLFPDSSEPLEEYTLQGKGKEKVLMVCINGFITDLPGRSVFKARPSMVQEVVSQFKLAEEDADIKAMVLQVNTPGGSTTASDILYEEIVRLKRKTGMAVVVAMMDVAASGGYYISLPADYIFAHPTTITGSVGVLFLTPKIIRLMKKIGLEVEVSKSGENKDMGSPFRESSEEENRIMDGVIDELGARFVNLVAEHRTISQASLSQISTGRVYLAKEALRMGLVDEIGYLEDAVAKAKNLAGIPENAKVIVYRRTEYPDDNLYNTSLSDFPGAKVNLIDTGFFEALSTLHTGFYYLWLPAANP